VKLLETIKVYEGRAFHLDYHQQRLERSLRTLGFTPAIDLDKLLQPPKSGLIRCRVIYDRNGAEVSYHSYLPRIFNTLQAVTADTLDYPLKYADRTELDALFAQRGRSQDILIVKKGLVTDTTIANVAFYDGVQWFTPERPLLQGTTRQRLLDEGKLIEREISYRELAGYERVAVMNAMLGFVEVKNGIIPPKHA
jgi:4-amino-4-deoxychorismate lyase